MPVVPADSLRDPTRYHIQWLMIGALWISFSITSKPFDRRSFVTK
jgi:hypothetical protein